MVDQLDGLRSAGRQLAASAGLVAGAAAIGYTAGRAAGVRSSLSEPRRPFEWRPERGKTVLLKGANVIDVSRGQVLKERGVSFRDGTITGLVATRDLEKAEADFVFDCTGLYLIPGLVNCHCHTLMPGSLVSPGVLLSVKRQAVRNFEECALRGVTTVRDAAGLPLVLQDIAGRIESLRLLGPRVVSCGCAITATGGYPDHLRPLPPWLEKKYGQAIIYADDPSQARDAVRRSVEQGARFIKIFLDERSLMFGRKTLRAMDDGTVKAVIEESHRLGRRVAVHQSQLVAFRRALKLGVDDLEHVPADGVIKDSEAAKLAAGDHHVTPTASVGTALGVLPKGHPSRLDPEVEQMQKVREAVSERDLPAVSEYAVQSLNNRTVEQYLSGEAGNKLGRMMFDNELFVEAIVNGTPNVAKLHAAGVKICSGNDGGVPMLFPALIGTEMEIMSMLGMPNVEVLRTATLNAAHLLDMQDQLGTIEPGKLADMVLLSANPIDDIRAVERVEGVFRSGVLLASGPRLRL